MTYIIYHIIVHIIGACSNNATLHHVFTPQQTHGRDWTRTMALWKSNALFFGQEWNHCCWLYSVFSGLSTIDPDEGSGLDW